jgi:arylsulfatase A-like enzyme
VLLVSLDTVRQDRLGCYGDDEARTPVIDRLAARGVRFADAVATTPLTLPSHATIMTGLYPPRSGVLDNGLYRLADEHETLAERLADHGYDTAAFVGCFVLDERFGLDQGFDLYDFEVSEAGYRRSQPDFNERPAEAVTDAAIRWLGERNRRRPTGPFFAWVHYFDPHLPYQSPLESQPAFAGRPYDAEIAWVDRQLGRLLDELSRLQLTDETLVVLVADHGESLGEHGEATHGMFVYDATVRVPLILSSPSLFGGPLVVSDRVVGLVDVRPTIEEVLGLPPTGDIDGVSLLRNDPAPGRAIYLETRAPENQWGWSPLHGLRTHTGKLVIAPVPEFYDLRLDPAELDNRHGDATAEALRLQGELAVLTRSWSGGDPTARAISDEEMARLGALGYLRSDPGRSHRFLPDPKAMVHLVEASTRAEALYFRGKDAEAADLAREVVDECPTCAQAVRVLAFSLMRLGRADEAIQILRDAVADARGTFLIRSLAQAMILDGQLDEVADVLELYARTDPTDGRVHLLRGDVNDRRGRPDEAIAEYTRALELDERRVGFTARERIERVTAKLTAAPGAAD